VGNAVELILGRVFARTRAFVNLIWPLLMLSFGPTWSPFRLPVQTPLLIRFLIIHGPDL